MEDKKMFSVEMPTDLHEALRRRAFIENLSVSKLVRKILESQLKLELDTVRKEINNGSQK